MKVLLIAYNNNSYIHYFPLGLAYVAAKLRQEGGEVAVYPQDKYHYSEEHLRRYLEEEHFSTVGVGMCAGYYQYAKLMKIAKAIPDGIALWLGGHLVTPAPEYFMEKTGAAYVCPGEYDYTINLDDLSLPAWDLFDIDYYSLLRLPHAENQDRCFPVLSMRGCPYSCSFCYRMHQGYRLRSVAGIVDEIEHLKCDYGITYIDFADELLMTSPERSVEIAKALKPLGIKWMCNGRLNVAKPSVLRDMKKAGCVFINYGIESVDDTVLSLMNKKLTCQQIVHGVEATLAVGISPGLNMLWGNKGDSVGTLWQALCFLKKYDDHAQMRTIRPVTPYPGCALYQEAIDKGLIKDIADFYENKHINSDLASIQFTGLSNQDFHQELAKANMELLDNHISYLHQQAQEQIDSLYLKEDISFRGFRQT